MAGKTNFLKAKSLTPYIPWCQDEVDNLGPAVQQFLLDQESYLRRWAHRWFENFQFIFGNTSVRWSRRYDFAVDVEGVVGIGVRGNWANEAKVLLLIDGMEMNETVYGTLQFSDRYPIDQVKRIEIIRGPGSSALNPRVPIIALTAHAMKGDRDLCMEAGMNDYVSKPTNVHDLAAANG